MPHAFAPSSVNVGHRLRSPSLRRLRQRARLMIRGPSTGTSAMETNVNEIQVGWSAYDEAGEDLGQVAEIGKTYVLVRKGLVLPTDLYIPASRIDSIDGRESTFTVAVLKEDVEHLGWENPPTDSAGTSTTDRVKVPYRP
jgi:hypothetical protein